MLISPSAQDPSVVASGGAVQKILEIQEEMIMIDKHNREHGSGNATGSCVYCERKRQHLGQQETGKPHRIKKKIRTSNEIERSVDASGKNGCLVVPRSWVGKRVKIILLDEKY
jgi:putative transposon-encoded protein